MDVHTLVQLKRTTQTLCRGKKERSTDLAVCAPRLVPSPRYFAKLTKLRLQRGAGRGGGAAAIGTDHARLVRVETAHAALVRCLRTSYDRITGDRGRTSRGIHEGVAALGLARQGGIDQAGIGRSRRRAVR